MLKKISIYKQKLQCAVSCSGHKVQEFAERLKHFFQVQNSCIFLSEVLV